MAKKKLDKLMDIAFQEIWKAEESLDRARSAMWEFSERVDQLEHCLRVIQETAYVDERGKIMVVPICEDPPKTLKAHVKFHLGMKRWVIFLMISPELLGLGMTLAAVRLSGKLKRGNS